jgi:cyclic pyranopterin phosphate synthase
MPEESLNGQGVFLPSSRLLSDDEIIRTVSVFASLGVHKLRLTGGEPLLRPGLTSLVERLSNIDGIDDLALTTNAILLPRMAGELKSAGLGRITVSLDSLDDGVFRQMSGQRGSAGEVLEGIAAAEAAGFGQIKINTVVQKDINDQQALALAGHFRGTGHIVRFIEFMDVGNLNHWSREQVVPSATLLKAIHDRWPVRPVARQLAGETARRYEYLDGEGEVGFISSITEPFCGDCTRARITADGVYYNCLFSTAGTPLRPLLRNGISEQGLREMLVQMWSARNDRYSEYRNGARKGSSKVEMFRMGG